MPESGRRVYATHVGRYSRVIAAPIRYVYAWCTDYRSDDGRFSASKPRFHVFRPAHNRVVRVRYLPSKASKAGVAVELVRLRPPVAWHLDQIDERDFNSVDYTLKRLGPRRTRISIVLTERWMVPDFPRKSDWVRSTAGYWDRLVAALESDYREGLPAQG